MNNKNIRTSSVMRKAMKKCLVSYWDLLCAIAYDNKSVDNTYPASLAMWFGFLANIVRNKKDIIFNGLGDVRHSEATWRVIDPVDNTNNLVGGWNNAKINELARWLENARDEMNRAIRYDEMGR